MNYTSRFTSARYDFAELDVLIAEDNEGTRRLLETMLSGLGVEKIRHAKSGNEALAILGAATPDLLITDSHMRPMDGLTLTRNIRQGEDDRLRFIPIILMTGRADKDAVKAARDVGVNMLLLKPVSVTALAERIAYLAEEDTPFVETKHYFGPDRRRKAWGYTPAEGERRRRLI